MERRELDLALRRLADRYAAAARAVLGPRLVAAVLFGSVARGKAGPATDPDLLRFFLDSRQATVRRITGGAGRRIPAPRSVYQMRTRL